jgi:hypothetical protein
MVDRRSTSPLAPPWPPTTPDEDRGKAFWAQLASGGDRKSMSGTLAWRQLLPFHEQLPATIANAQWTMLGGRLRADGFSYPHGVSIILHATAKPHSPMHTVVQALLALRRDTVTLAINGATPVNGTLDDTATRLLAYVEERIGHQEHNLAGPAEPFTIATIVSATGDAAKFASDETAQRDANALAVWPSSMKNMKKPDLEKSEIELGPSFDEEEHLIASDHGRTWWSPSRFRPPNPGVKTQYLSQLHRELSNLSMHVQSLAHLLRVLDDDQRELAPTLLACRRLAAQLLGRLYGQASRSYQSPSVRRQLEDGGYVAAINTARDRDDLPPLFA